MEYHESKKPSSVFSWLGFGISLAVFLIVCLGAFVLFFVDEGPRVVFDYMLMVLACGLIGTLGFIFSVVGLVIANKHDLPKWMSVSGIILCCLSVIAFFSDPLETFYHNEPHRVIIPESIQALEKSENMVVFVLDADGNVTCSCNDIYDDIEVMFSLRTSSDELELKAWIATNVADRQVVIYANKEVPYSQTEKLIELLNECGISKFSLQTE